MRQPARSLRPRTRSVAPRRPPAVGRWRSMRARGRHQRRSPRLRRPQRERPGPGCDVEPRLTRPRPQTRDEPVVDLGECLGDPLEWRRTPRESLAGLQVCEAVHCHVSVRSCRPVLPWTACGETGHAGLAPGRASRRAQPPSEPTRETDPRRPVAPIMVLDTCALHLGRGPAPTAGEAARDLGHAPAGISGAAQRHLNGRRTKEDVAHEHTQRQA
jgi:hypothetical protein